MTKKLSPLGLWSNRDEVESGLQKITSKKDKLEALKVQINFRRKVLGQSHEDKSVFYFSHNRKALTINELKLNLLKLIPESESIQVYQLSADKITAHPDLLLYRRIKHRFECDGTLQWFDGTVLKYSPDTKEYCVQYDNEDETFSFALLDDYIANDLQIVS